MKLKFKKEKALLVGEKLREALGKESGGVGDKERVGRVENGTVERVDCGESR